jgi:hypothetical protein
MDVWIDTRPPGDVLFKQSPQPLTTDATAGFQLAVSSGALSAGQLSIGELPSVAARAQVDQADPHPAEGPRAESRILSGT